MTHTINRRDVMVMAWDLVRQLGISMSDALTRSWAMHRKIAMKLARIARAVTKSLA